MTSTVAVRGTVAQQGDLAEAVAGAEPAQLTALLGDHDPPSATT